MPRKIWELEEEFDGIAMLHGILDFLNRHLVHLIFGAVLIACVFTLGG